MVVVLAFFFSLSQLDLTGSRPSNWWLSYGSTVCGNLQWKAQCPVVGQSIVRTVSVVPLQADLGSHVCTHACAYVPAQVQTWYI